MDCSPPGSSVHGDSPGKNTGVGCHALLQGIVQTQGLNPGPLHCTKILYCLSHQESPRACKLPEVTIILSHFCLPPYIYPRIVDNSHNYLLMYFSYLRSIFFFFTVRIFRQISERRQKGSIFTFTKILIKSKCTSTTTSYSVLIHTLLTGNYNF